MMLSDLRSSLSKLQDPTKAIILSRFSKTGKGEYGEGDVFLGVTVPQSRIIANKYSKLSYIDISKLLKSKIHEERLIALLILVQNFTSGSDTIRKDIYDFYLANTKRINNWDLVDLTAPKIVGAYLLGKKDKTILTYMARSKNLWEKRISMIATYEFISKKKEYKDTFEIAEILLSDRHDLIQKAVGWMLREVGKRISEDLEREFLDKYYKQMGRTALRYAIERFEEKTRKKYLGGNI